MTRKEFIAEVRNVAEGNLYTHAPMSTRQPPIFGWESLEMCASDLYDRLHGAKPQGSAQLYFKDVDSENCYPLEDHLEEAREAGLKKITLLRAGVYGEEYAALFTRFTVMLLPFSPATYHEYRPSQVFQEAVAADIPCIICTGGFMGYEAEKQEPVSVEKAIRDLFEVSLAA